jgi:hypothetical protein
MRCRCRRRRRLVASTAWTGGAFWEIRVCWEERLCSLYFESKSSGGISIECLTNVTPVDGAAFVTVAKGRLTAVSGCPLSTARITPAGFLYNYMFGVSHKIRQCVPIFAKIVQIQQTLAVYIFVRLYYLTLILPKGDIVLCEVRNNAEGTFYNFCCSTVHFDNIKVFLTNKCTIY